MSTAARTTFNQDLLTFLSNHYDGGVISHKGYKESLKVPTSSFGDLDTTIASNFDVRSGPYEIKGTISGDLLPAVSFELTYQLLPYGGFHLASASGLRILGVEAKFDVIGVTSGTVRVFTQGRDVLCTIKALNFGEPYVATFKIGSL